MRAMMRRLRTQRFISKSMFRTESSAMRPILTVFLVLVSADSYQPFEDFDKCHIADEECPNSNITFWLYTRDTMDNPMQLDMTNTEAMSRAVLGKSKRVFVLLHGYTGYKDFSPNPEIRPEIMRHGDHSVISVDYKPLAPEPCYIQAVHNLPLVANCTAQLLDYMMSQSMFSLKDLHIIGFSLGAQTAGMIGTFVKTGKLLRITGLDPAKPLFTFAPAEYKLTKDKAVFVDVLHTDILARGVLRAAGHADFYVNGGIEQPGCSFQRNTSTGSCNHSRAPQYYAESINSPVGFWGFKCDKWQDWALGMCSPATSEELAIMGWKATNESKGIFFVNTNKEPPYAKGVLPEFTLSDNGTETTTVGVAES